jgi:hypothetical protein
VRPHLLGDAPVTMILPVLEPMVTMQKWLGLTHGHDATKTSVIIGRGWVRTKPLLNPKPPKIIGKCAPKPFKKKLKPL